MKTQKIISGAGTLLVVGVLFFGINACSEQTSAQSETSETTTVVDTDRPARDNSEVRPSPNASTSQTIGTTVVTIDYGRPGVKGRKVFGELEQYGATWRAGANEATVISFSDDVTINGETLPAGNYAFFAIPNETEWTLIFNKKAEQWGAYDYDAGQDALRITVQPEEGAHQEWLSYSFEDLTSNSVKAILHWSTTKVPFTVGIGA